MEKTVFFEPSGNELSLKCKIKANITKSHNGPVRWYQLLSKDDAWPQTIISQKLNETKFIKADQWDQFEAAFGTRMNSDRQNSATKSSEIQFQQDGQKIKFKQIAHRQNGFYTCIYRAACKNQTSSEYRIIGT